MFILTNIGVDVAVVIADPQVPKNGRLVEVGEGNHVIHPILAQILAGLHLKKICSLEPS